MPPVSMPYLLLPLLFGEKGTFVIHVIGDKVLSWYVRGAFKKVCYERFPVRKKRICFTDFMYIFVILLYIHI